MEGVVKVSDSDHFGDGWIAALFAGIVAVLGSVWGGLASWRRWRAQSEKTALRQWIEHVEYQDQRIEALEAKVSLLERENGQKNAIVGEALLICERAFGAMERQKDCLERAAPHLPKDFGPLPAVPPRSDLDRLVFLARTSAQNRLLVDQVEPKSQPPGGAIP